MLTIEAHAGMRAVPFGGWEAFVELTRPITLGPLTVPLQVAEDGSRVTIWLGTASMASRSAAVTTDASSFSLTFVRPDGSPRGSVAIPMVLSTLTPPAVPTPDVHPSAPEPGPGTAAAAPATTPVPTSGAVSTPAGGAATSTWPATRRVGTARAALGRY